MKRKIKVVKNPVAKHAHKFNRARVQADERKELARKACRGHKPGSLFWLI